MIKKISTKFYLASILLTLLTIPCLGFSERELTDGLSHIGQLEAESSSQFRLAKTLEKALNFYDSLTDYKTNFFKTEKAKGVLGPTEEIYLKFEKTFKIYMRWLNTDKEGVEVVYARGKNKGKLAVHKPGLLFGLAPVVFLDQNSPWIKEGSASYNIEDAGIGSFLYDFTGEVIKASRENKLKVDYLGKTTEEGLTGESVEVTFIDSTLDSGYLAYRVRILFDEITSLPIKMELFDWQNEPMGIYIYKDLQFNLGAEDAEFKNQINYHLLKVYNK
ncbi:MAG: hypothetical protein AUJ72_00575 [Candidatus Omnitrophica bacterium CG1_02_46_14]|nr:MAG: hypothetical protein AUJ72_00575 [Candidatus Omnitrophica bacterium CG1_02_46_14]